jgi:hypothetical protein
MDTAQFLPFAATKGVTFYLRDGMLMAHAGTQSAKAWRKKAAEEIGKRKAEILEILQAGTPVNLAAVWTHDEKEKKTILHWLDRIGEDDMAIIAEVLKKCQADPDAKAYFLMRAGEA